MSKRQGFRLALKIERYTYDSKIGTHEREIVDANVQSVHGDWTMRDYCATIEEADALIATMVHIKPEFKGMPCGCIYLACPHCGEGIANGIGLDADGLVNTHDFPKPCRQVCKGSGLEPVQQSPTKVHTAEARQIESRYLITLGKELFSFDSFQDWVDGAKKKFRGYNAYKVICLDTAGRICKTGKEFMRARDENCFPVKAYSI